MNRTFDVVILGSGFAGSIAALTLDRCGLRVAVIDKARHPRFAIGESSTPIANRVLADLAKRYDLPRLAPLTKYGSWQRSYPHLGCGLKRGFSYFQHQVGEPFPPRADHANELLVAASADDEHSDTQWLRADVDQFLADEVRAAGIPLVEGAIVRELATDRDSDRPDNAQQRDDATSAEPNCWTVRAEQEGRTFEWRTEFLIDGTGDAGLVLRARRVADEVRRWHTNSRAVFSHFRGVGSWTEWLAARGDAVAEHPFPCDDAAQHQLLDDAWMWLLRFNHGIASVGLAIDARRAPLDTEISADVEWRQWLDRYPSVAELLRAGQIVTPPGRIIRTGRLQRRAARAAGANWAALPHTAGFIDPLHSSGIAHSLCGVERLVAALTESANAVQRTDRLAAYEETVFRELELIDRLVDGCYRTLGRFSLFTAWSMFYFAAATTYERRRSERGFSPDIGFLCANESAFFDTVIAAHGELTRLMAGRLANTASNVETDAATAAFMEYVADRLRPFNHVGLCDPQTRNMYRYTTAPV